MDFIKEAFLQNEHWETGKILIPRAPHRIVQRDAFPLVERASKHKFAVFLTGLRRVGKSVLARQVLQHQLAQKKQASELAWFEFDRSMGAQAKDLDDLLVFFGGRGAKVVVLDEIAFVHQWQETLKRHYDLSDIKFIVTGSSALEMDKHAAESMTGRFQRFFVKPFSFREYLHLKAKKIPETERQTATHGEETRIECEKYLYSGGLPEAILLNEKERGAYLRHSVLEPLFFKDISAVFPSANPDLLLKVLELLAATSSSTFQFQSFSNVLGCSHPTIATQVEILTRGFLAKPLFNYTKSLMKQKRTTKKILISDNGLLANLNPQISLGALAENAVGNSIDAEQFWRDAEGREIDFVMPKKRLAIEVKYQEHITAADTKNMTYFLKNHQNWKGILITKREEKKGKKIRWIPLWKWLLYPTIGSLPGQ